MSEKQINCTLNVREGIYEFSDGYKMPIAHYDEFVAKELGGEYPTEPVETSQAIFKARWRQENKR